MADTQKFERLLHPNINLKDLHSKGRHGGCLVDVRSDGNIIDV